MSRRVGSGRRGWGERQLGSRSLVLQYKELLPFSPTHSRTSALIGGHYFPLRSSPVIPIRRANKAKVRAMTEIQKMPPIFLEARTGETGCVAGRMEPGLKVEPL